LKMTAQLTPLGAADAHQAHLEIKPAETWVHVSTADIIRPGFTATFAVDDWDSKTSIPYRVVYTTTNRAGHEQTDYFGGLVRRDPVDKTAIVVAGFTGNHNVSHEIGRQPFDWRQGMWFPHQEVSDHVTAHDPDILFFSGDQIYEGRSPTFPDTNNILLDYLYKWYLWSWAYRDLTRNIPTVTIPDDHDVFQGNVWGEGGRKAVRDHFGGYVHPAEFVKMVERTQTSHLPDAYDPTKIDQGIGVYYTGMTYGRISFAILEDRKFKSGCAGRLPPTGTARPDHINNPDFDVLKADVPGLTLLGDRQLTFLEDWAGDWKGADMKMAMSQTIFANMATHHGGALQYLIADLDSNGWPQTGRNKAISKLRKGFAFHLAGDQHLATIVHHGVEQHNDSIWSFCVPSIANFYPRMWQPRVAGANRPAGAPTWQGEHFDGFRNRVTVYAATNPGPDMGHEPKALHNGMPGYGIVTLDKSKRTIRMECWPRFADPTDPEARPYPGWPRTIAQTDNYLRTGKAFLPTIETDCQNPVIQIIHDASGEIIYTLRIKGSQFTPKVFEPGTYTVVVSMPDKQWTQSFKNIKATPGANGKLEVTLTP
ncbi:MAG: alkaline phosphatase D family protein, partial [Pseudomonadales bacterium]|nr:alkaline phosphatase D family protein [Pseudomonadales bacterium]